MMFLCLGFCVLFAHGFAIPITKDSQDDTSAFASFTQVKYNTFAELMKYSMVPEPLDEVGEITNTSTYVITKDKTTLVLPVDNVQDTIYSEMVKIPTSTDSMDEFKTSLGALFPKSLNVHGGNTNKCVERTSTNASTEETSGTNMEKKKRFELMYSKMNWDDAYAFCEFKGGNLATIKTEEENTQALEKLYNSLKPLNQVWIGGLCLKSRGTCIWTDSFKQFEYQDFGRGEPNYLVTDEGIEKCVEFKDRDFTAWKWNDDICSKEFPFLCQYWD